MINLIERMELWLFAKALAQGGPTTPEVKDKFGIDDFNFLKIFGPKNNSAQEALGAVITNIVQFLLLIVGIIAFVMFVVAGFQYLTAGGNEETVEKARTTMINTIIGIVVIAIAYIIVRFIGDKLSGQ